LGKIGWLGHSGFEIELADKILFIDPWLTGNPLAAMRASDVKKADIVCVTHDHGDQLGTPSKFVNKLEPSAESFIKIVKEKAPEVRVVALKPGEAYQL